MRKLSSNPRRKLAALLVALYAVCVLAPHAALALSHGNMASHCLTENSAAPHDHKTAKAQMHSHNDGAGHEHITAQTKDGDDNTPAVCCGLFFMTALAAGTYPVALYEASAGKVAAAAQDSHADHPPGRLHRPPIL